MGKLNAQQDISFIKENIKQTERLKKRLINGNEEVLQTKKLRNKNCGSPEGTKTVHSGAQK